MFSTKDYLFESVTKSDINHVSPAALFHYCSDPSVKAFMGQTLLLARIHLYDYLRTKRVFGKQLAQLWFAFFP
jgi:hypothetical protein